MEIKAMDNDWIIDGLEVIARRRGMHVTLGDVEIVQAAAEALRGFREIGILHRGRNGVVHFTQKEEVMDFPLQTTLTIYVMDEPSPNAARSDSKEKP
jgi:hypothetical protein